MIIRLGKPLALRMSISMTMKVIIAEDDSIEERVDACELLYEMRVRFLREDRMRQESDDSDSEDEDMNDNWRPV